VVEPILPFFPLFSQKIVLGNLKSCQVPIPKGRLLTKLAEFYRPTSPAEIVAETYSSMRNFFFRAHPFMTMFKHPRVDPRRHSDDCAAFLHCFFHGIQALAGLPLPLIGQIVDHIITLDIYKRATSGSLKNAIDPWAGNPSETGLAFSEAVLARFENVALPTPTIGRIAEVNLVPGRNGFFTIAAENDICEGSFICDCCGVVLTVDDVDCSSVVPDFNNYWIVGTDFVLTRRTVDCSPAYWRIRRGIASNCQVRLYSTGSDVRAGIFATELTLISTLCHHNVSKLEASSKVVISAGEELVLPFDLPPVSIRADLEWKSGKFDRRLLDVESIRPVAPSVRDAPRWRGGASRYPCSPTTLAMVFGREPSAIPEFVITESSGLDLPSVRIRRDLPDHLTPPPPLGPKSWYLGVPPPGPPTRMPFMGSRHMESGGELPVVLDEDRPPQFSWDWEDPDDFVDSDDVQVPISKNAERS
jgi:hypothetical protein